MKYATGKDSRVEHATGTFYDEEKKEKKRKYMPVKHSVGSETSIKHSTGISFERRAADELVEEPD